MEEEVSNKNVHSTVIENIVREAWLEFQETATVSKIQTKTLEKVWLAADGSQKTLYDIHRIFLSLILCLDKTANLEFGINVYATEQTVLEKAVGLMSSLTDKFPKIKKYFDNVKALLMVQAVFACCRTGNWTAARTISDRLRIHEFYKDYPGSLWHITSQLVVKKVLKECDLCHTLLRANRFDYTLFLKYDVIPLLEHVYNSLTKHDSRTFKGMQNVDLKIQASSSNSGLSNSSVHSAYGNAGNKVVDGQDYITVKHEYIDPVIMDNNIELFADGSDLQLSTVEVDIISSDTFEEEKQDHYNNNEQVVCGISSLYTANNELMISIDDPCVADMQVGCNIELCDTNENILSRMLDINKVGLLKNEIEAQLLDKDEQFTIDQVTSLFDERSLENIDIQDLLLTLCDTMMVPQSFPTDGTESDKTLFQQNGNKCESRLSGNIVGLVESICTDRDDDYAKEREKIEKRMKKNRRREEKDKRKAEKSAATLKKKHKPKKFKHKKSTSSEFIQIKKRKKQNFWTDEEELKLAKGVLIDGLFGKWAEIKVKYDIRNRTGVDIRRKWGNIVNHQSTGKFKKLRKLVLKLPDTDSD